MSELEPLAEKYERLLQEERERTTIMTLANADKRRELRTLREQNTTLVAALNVVVPWIGKAIADEAFAGTATPLAAEKALEQAEAAIAAAS